MNLEAIGWGEPFASAFEPYRAKQLAPGRIASSLRGAYLVWTEEGEVEAPARAKLIRGGTETRPCTGDWVALRTDSPLIEATLPRRTKLSRKAPGEPTVEQILAANIDTVFIVAGLDRDYNPRRIERYMAIAWDSGARPVVVLNKADLCADTEGRVAETRALAGDADVVLASAHTGDGIQALKERLRPARTAVFIGSSGVGKSALTNVLLGYDLRAVAATRDADGRGRHTTVGRELILAPQGWLLMDLPGIREVQAWGDTGLEEAFDDVEELIAACRFSDCKHGGEPGCAVREALADGALDRARYRNYLAVQQERATLARRRAEREGMESNRRLRQSRNKPRKPSKRR